MDDPRPEKVAVVDEVRRRLDGADAAILTEYRGLTVAELAQLRRALSAVGGDYKVYKNTLVRRAVAGGRHEPLTEMLSGPTAIAFVTGEISAVAKALRDFSRTYPALILKGGQHGEGVLSSADLVALADLPSREVLLSRVAGAIAAPMQQMAGLLQALPRNLAYGLAALLEQRGGAPEPEPVVEAVAEPVVEAVPEAPQPAAAQESAPQAVAEAAAEESASPAEGAAEASSGTEGETAAETTAEPET